ncbi:hypothetical protein [Streptosporangium vulgare]|uniref:hypothetical protein n=1 Tax=Streptosporangium vulgare TaxID=46190 RepID=UPI0031D28125
MLALRVARAPLRGVDLNRIDGVGLISAMPLTAFAASWLMVVAFSSRYGQNTDRKFLLLLPDRGDHLRPAGAAALIEDEAGSTRPRPRGLRGSTSTARAVCRPSSTPAWRGRFYRAVAFVTKAPGVTDLTMIMRWTPLLSNLLYLLPFVLILRRSSPPPGPAGSPRCCSSSCSGSARTLLLQGFTYAIYLAFVAIVAALVRQGWSPARNRCRPRGSSALRARLDGLDTGRAAALHRRLRPAIMADRADPPVRDRDRLAPDITPVHDARRAHRPDPAARSSLSWGLPSSWA